MAAKYIPEGEGLASEGWNIKREVIARNLYRFSEALLEANVKSS